MEEIRLQCRFTSHAWQEMRSSLVGMDNEKTFFYVHAFLNHANQASQILWPESQTEQEKGSELRKALDLPQENTICSKSLKRIVENFGERLELWMGTVEAGHFLNLNVMPKGTMAGSREDVFVRSLDPETYQLEILDQTFDLRKLNQAIRQLDKQADHWLKKH